MSLLEEIQNEAVSSNSDIGTVLRKCRILGARLGSRDLEEWLVWESDGYPDEVDVPDYRTWAISVVGNFSGPLGGQIRNGPVPHVCIPESVRDQVTQFKCRQSVATLHATLRDTDSPTFHTSLGDLSVLLSDNVYAHHHCLDVRGEFSRTHIMDVVNTVRNKVLGLVLEIWKLDPDAGELMTESSVPAPQVAQIFNTTIHGGSSNLVGMAANSTLTFGIKANDLESLQSFLRSHNVEEEDIVELSEALQEEPRQSANEPFGPRVTRWIGGMMQKAASGVWNVGVDVAGTLIAKALSEYCGLQQPALPATHST